MTLYELLLQFDKCKLDIEVDNGRETFKDTAEELLNWLTNDDLNGEVVEFSAERDGSVSVAYHKARG